MLARAGGRVCGAGQRRLRLWTLIGLSGLAGLGTVVATAPAASAAASPLQITTTALPDGTKGQPYPTTALAASGGTQPYTWSAAPASQPVPPGLTVSPQGVISGTPPWLAPSPSRST